MVLPGGPDQDPERQEKFEALAAAVAGFGGKSVEVRFGVGTVTFTASATSAALAVAHGLGRVPVVVLAAEITSGFGVIYRTNTYTATQFTVVGSNPFGATTSTPGFAWIAIG